jgi:mono/diheme cytochrome c family protein
MAAGPGRGSRLFAAGVVFALAAVFAGGWIYLRWGHPPVAVADKAFPFEADIVRVPLGARIAREMEKPPYAGNEEVYLSGAMVYKDNCASCHGVPRQDADQAKYMYPPAPQLFKTHTTGSAVGVSDDDPGETYWKVKNGIRLTGMPAFEKLLTTEEMWDVSLLLKAADQPMSPQVKGTLTK